MLRGGGRAVGDWAREHGFGLSVDAPEVLDFYADRSPIFMAASFDARRAATRGQRLGDGTPIHLTIPTGQPLGAAAHPRPRPPAGRPDPGRPVPAHRPAPGHAAPAGGAGARGVALEQSGPASGQLLADLRADKGMGWLPASGMWLSYLRIDSTAGELTHDLAVDTSGRRRPSPVAAGLAVPASVAGEAGRAPARAGRAVVWPAAGLAVTAALAGLVLARRGRSALR